MCRAVQLHCSDEARPHPNPLPQERELDAAALSVGESRFGGFSHGAEVFGQRPKTASETLALAFSEEWRRKLGL